MFAARCEAEGRTVLLGTRRITDLRVESDRVTIAFTCWCGHEGVVVDHRSPGDPPGTDRRQETPTPVRPPADRPAAPVHRTEAALGPVPASAAA